MSWRSRSSQAKMMGPWGWAKEGGTKGEDRRRSALGQPCQDAEL